MADTNEIEKSPSTSSSEPDIPVDEEEEKHEEVGEAVAVKVDSHDDGDKKLAATSSGSPSAKAAIKPATPRATTGRKTEESAMASTERTDIRKRLEMAVKTTHVEGNRSSDLVPLTQQYEANRKTLRSLHAAAKAYQEGVRDLHSKRIEMMKHMSKIAEDTPLFDAVGKPKDKNDEDNDVERSPKSLDARVRMCAAESGMQGKQFDTTVLDYVLEWDRVTSERITAELKEAGKLKSTRSHYEDKVNKLRKEQHECEEKGKKMKKSNVEKLERNEDKLHKAYNEHEEYCGHLCVLIEEASTNIGRWRDLLPLARGYMKWESDRCASEMRLIGNLDSWIAKMEADAKEASTAQVIAETTEKK